jgi:hypothetical protein
MRYERILIDDDRVRLRVDTYDAYPGVGVVHCRVLDDMQRWCAVAYIKRWRHIREQLRDEGFTLLMAMKPDGDDRWVRFCTLFGFRGDENVRGYRTMRLKLGD